MYRMSPVSAIFHRLVWGPQWQKWEAVARFAESESIESRSRNVQQTVEARGTAFKFSTSNIDRQRPKGPKT